MTVTSDLFFFVFSLRRPNMKQNLLMAPDYLKDNILDLCLACFRVYDCLSCEVFYGYVWLSQRANLSKCCDKCDDLFFSSM